MLHDMTNQRVRMPVSKSDAPHIITDGKRVLNFAGNDYLNLSQDARIKQCFTQAAELYGLGSGASAMVTGYTVEHEKLEVAAAKFLNRECSILFNSGYHANLAVISALADRHTNIVADKHIHASLIDGIQLSNAKLHRYQHNDLEHAETLLAKDSLFITESVFSMSGETSNAKRAAQLAHRHQAKLIIDDAHGVGVLGETGRGVAEAFHLSSHDLPVLITPLGKAIGSMGATVSGNKDEIEYILQHARTYFYSTALPPAVCAATAYIFEILEQESWRTTKLKELCHYFIEQAHQLNIQLIADDATPIKCILIKDNAAVLRLQKYLLDNGFYAAAIRPPTVAENHACLRISLTCAHSKVQVTQLLTTIANHVN